jgi:hypothetical protein
MIVLGIDVGNSGAVALLEDGELLAVFDIPVLRDGAKRRPAVNAPLLRPSSRRSSSRLTLRRPSSSSSAPAPAKAQFRAWRSAAAEASSKACSPPTTWKGDPALVAVAA